MINHVVLFKLKAYPAEEKSQIIANIKEMLLGLKGKIDELKYIEVGENYELDSKSFDLALITHFESVEGLDVYRVHPEHVKVAAYIGGVVEARAAVDFNF
ncbi:Dabb family protein [Maribellus sp. CM-23]|uniref:Dabb family protein n=1 Tax=Maribellus sp. CM-23 TaxID=2781026 RepID=UPI001F38E767|nr:Dabb family protein [Maribellus sp. CM-23]MCE4562908.1 Dabb family protein [Maribellus sp. CM-23]